MFSHRPVLLDEVIEGLNIRPDGIYADGTLGGGGHSEEIAKRLTEGGRLIGVDRDEDAIEAAGKRLSPVVKHIVLVPGLQVIQVGHRAQIIKIDEITAAA